MESHNLEISENSSVATKILKTFRTLVAAAMLATAPTGTHIPAHGQTMDISPNDFKKELEDYRVRVTKEVQKVLEERGGLDRPKTGKFLRTYLCAVAGAQPSNMRESHFRDLLGLWQDDTGSAGLVQGFARKAEESDMSEQFVKGIEDIVKSIPGCDGIS